MFLLLVTNRGSNILEDLDTLRLLSKLVPEYAGTMLDEEAVSRAAFDLIFAFDEVISLGHKENISVMQVRLESFREGGNCGSRTVQHCATSCNKGGVALKVGNAGRGGKEPCSSRPHQPGKQGGAHDRCGLVVMAEGLGDDQGGSEVR